MTSPLRSPLLAVLVGAPIAVLAPAAATAQPKPSTPAPVPKPGGAAPASNLPAPSGIRTVTLRKPPLPPNTAVLVRRPPWRFEDLGDVFGWTRTGSFASDAIIRCPSQRPRRSGELPVTAGAKQLGGNYWDVPLMPDGHGCWLESAPGRGQATTPELPITARYLHFRLGGNGVTRVELHAHVGNGFIKIRDWQGDTTGQPKPHVHDFNETYPNAFLGKRFKLVLKDDSDNGNLVLDTVELTDQATAAAAPAQLWGFVDLHTHPMSQIGFGGNLFHGSIHPSITHAGTLDDSWRRRNANPAATALPACTKAHGDAPGGGTLLLMLDERHHASGFPEFIGWPHHHTKVHQQMYVDWLKRAWTGGLRVLHADITHSHLLATLYGHLAYLRHNKLPNPIDDDWNIVTQAKAMKLLLEQPEVSSFAELATSAADVRRIVGRGKLAVVLGVEVEDFGHFTKKLAGKTPEQARPLLRDYLAELTALGIRHLFPVHLTDNVFGGTAVYEEMFLAANVIERGKPISFRNAFGAGVRLRLDHLGLSKLMSEVLTLPGMSDFRAQMRAGLLLSQRPLGHANALGLTAHGTVLIEELMRAGFIIDVDHMSDLATDQALELVKRHGYPVVSSHTGLRDMMFGASLFREVKVGDQVRLVPEPNTGTSFEPSHAHALGTTSAAAMANERARTAEQLAKIRDLGGMIGLGTGSAVAPYAYETATGVRAPADCDGSTKSMAQSYLYLIEQMQGRGVALGTDMNGMPDSLVPRFGPAACRSAAKDGVRGPTLRAQVDAQRGTGVRYRDERRHNYGRFTPFDGHVYDSADAITWAAIERFRAKLGDQPPADLGRPQQRMADRIAYGLWVQSKNPNAPLEADQFPDVRDDVRRGQQLYIDVHRNQRSTDPAVARMRTVWDAFHAIDGANPPLAKSQLGATDFDFNLDGLVHYGLLPDMLQDFRNIGLTDGDLAPLFHGAEHYARMWERIEAASAAVRQQIR